MLRNLFMNSFCQKIKALILTILVSFTFTGFSTGSAHAQFVQCAAHPSDLLLSYRQDLNPDQCGRTVGSPVEGFTIFPDNFGTVNIARVIGGVQSPVTINSCTGPGCNGFGTLGNRAFVDCQTFTGGACQVNFSYTNNLGETVAAVIDILATTSDPANNGGNGLVRDIAAFTPFSGTPDTAGPTLDDVLIVGGTTPSNRDVIFWRFDFSEPVVNFNAADLTLSGTTAVITSVTSQGGGTQQLVRVEGGDLANLNGTVSIALAGGASFQDGVGNEFDSMGAATPPNHIMDNIAPTLVIGPNTANTDFTATFQIGDANDVTGITTFDESDVTITNATKGTASDQGNGLYHIPMTSLTGSDMVVTVPAGSFTDIAGNQNALTTRTISFNDTTAPRVNTITRKTPAASPTNADSLTWSVIFDEGVQNVDGTDFAVAELSGENIAVTALSANVYDVTVTGGDIANFNGTVTLGFAGGQNIQDLAATPNSFTNTTPLGTNNNTYVLDNTGPTVTNIVRNATTSPTNADTISWRITFSDPVSAVDVADFDVAGTTATVTSVGLSGNVRTVTVSGGDLANLNGTVTLSFASGQNIVDDLGNPLTPSTLGDNTFVIDNIAPTVAIGPASASSDFTATFQISDANDVAGINTFTTDDVTITNATKGAFSNQGNGLYHIAMSALTGSDMVVTIPANSFTDAAGNSNALTTRTVSFNDSTAPRLNSVSRSNPSEETTNVDQLRFAIVFSERVQNVDGSDFDVPELTGETITVVANGRNSNAYNVTVNNGDIADFNGAVSLALRNTQNITDFAATPNALTDLTVSGTNEGYILDNNRPVVFNILHNTSGGSPTNSDTLSWQVIYNANVVNVDASDFVISGTTATITNLLTSNNTTFVTISGGDLASLNGTVTLSFAAGQDIEDPAGNTLIPSTPGSNTYEVDNSAPTPVITPSVSTSNGVNFTAEIDFGMAVTGFVAGDLNVGAGSVFGALVDNGNGSFTATIDPDDSGDITIDIAANAANDAAGNQSDAATQARVTFDNTRAAVSISAILPPGGTNAPFTATFTFNKEMTGADRFVIGDITPGNATLSAFQTVTPETVYSVLVTPTAQGAMTLDVAESIAQDAAGNFNTAAAQFSTNFDDIRPNVTFLNVPSQVTNGTPFTITVQFDEDVTGFDATTADVVVTNGSVTATNTVDARNYDVTVTPSSDQDVTIDVIAGAAQDAALNDNALASVTVSSTIIEDTQKVIASFQHSRANQLIANQPSLTGFLSGNSSGSFNADVTKGFGTFNFAGKVSPNNNLWFRLKGSWSEEGTRETEYFFGALGSHYEVNENFLLGGMLAFDHLSQDDVSSQIEGTGWLAGPYFVAKLPSQKLFFEGRLLYGESSNDVSPFGTYTDAFDTERLLAQFKVSGDLNYGATTFRPNVQISYTTDNQKAYTDSLGNFIPGQEIELGQIELGLDMSHYITFEDNSALELTGGMAAIGSSTKGSGNAASVVPEFEGGRARLKFGANYNMANGGRLVLDTFYDGIGASGYESYGLEIGFDLKF